MGRAPRHLESASRPNKRMHATADTRDVIFLQGLGAARDARRYASSPHVENILLFPHES
jgi:ketosteroid isomerase-like protein